MLPIATSTFATFATNTLATSIDAFMYLWTVAIPYFLVMALVVSVLVVLRRLFLMR